jgi:hypothetical protein
LLGAEIDTDGEAAHLDETKTKTLTTRFSCLQKSGNFLTKVLQEVASGTGLALFVEPDDGSNVSLGGTFDDYLHASSA